MQNKFAIPAWVKIPLLRILIPFIIGIAVQWYISPSITSITKLSGFALLQFGSYYLIPLTNKYLLRWISGIGINLLLFCFGNAIVWVKDIRHNSNWVGHTYSAGNTVVVTLQEPLVEKTKSYKALAKIDAVQTNGVWQPVKGNVLLYFKKDSTKPALEYGHQIVFNKTLQPINNSGNPGAFNYQRFCAFQDIHHQVFLKATDYTIADTTQQNGFWQAMFNIRNHVIGVLRKNISGEDEQAVAEALLIGYRDDLDKDLVQAYSNTGVVHIIAISGLHLGMIYATLVWLLKPLRRYKISRWLNPIIILGVLWLFSLIAGAAPSILRSAVMFSFIVFGDIINRRNLILNTLGASAFALLLYNPFFLWDVGFQLSYAAVISIIIFMKPVYNWLQFDNKAIDFIWQLNSVTIAAQVFTLPIVLYHFHQFPNLFLISNFVAVPISSLILYGELLLLLCSAIPALADMLGTVCTAMLTFLNNFIQNIDSSSFAVTDGIQISSLQAYLLFAILIAAGYWLLRKSKTACISTIAFTLAFVLAQSIDIINRNTQQKLVVYNVPQHRAIDIIEGRKHLFIGDDVLLEDGFLQNFHLKPARILHRTTRSLTPEQVLVKDSILIAGKNTILLVKQKITHRKYPLKMAVDAIVVSNNPNINIAEMAAYFDCKTIVFDASNPLWKINKWKKDCDSLHLRHHSVPEKGAFEMAL